MTTRATRIRPGGAPSALIGVLASLILLAGASAPVPLLAETGETAGLWYGAANREVFNRFWDYVAHEGVSPGVYSTSYQWGVIMSGNTSIPHTWEWTAQVSVANSPAPCPGGFQASSWQFADFYGGQGAASRDTAMWQWSLGSADYDQIDRNKPLPLTMH